MAIVNPESLLPLKPDTFHILLALQNGPMHGYALMKHLAEQTQGRLVLLPGALYRRLGEMLDKGLIDEAGETSSQRRRPFAITAFGQAVAESEAVRLDELVEIARGHQLLNKKAHVRP